MYVNMMVAILSFNVATQFLKGKHHDLRLVLNLNTEKQKIKADVWETDKHGTRVQKDGPEIVQSRAQGQVDGPETIQEWGNSSGVPRGDCPEWDNSSGGRPGDHPE